LDMSQREDEPFGRYHFAELARLQKFRAIVGAKDDTPPATRIGRYLAVGDLEPIRGKPGLKLGGVDPIFENLLARSVIIDVNLEVLACAHPVTFPSGPFGAARERLLRGAEIDRPIGIDRPSATHQSQPTAALGFGSAGAEHRALASRGQPLREPRCAWKSREATCQRAWRVRRRTPGPSGDVEGSRGASGLRAR